ncbi:MAG: hypothetical protein KME06_12705 [Kastovskya adunca ATA6-11-RM4]|jgi:hypothetical protein|nr:hypothetical protein [Kastovskya adunca ATA6-11-RM4]
MFISSFLDDSSAFPSELVQFSSTAALNGFPLKKKRQALYHASPLMPLRDRDLDALEGFFERDDIEEIQADIACTLLWLVPAPCWEDSPFDLEFLGEYL